MRNRPIAVERWRELRCSIAPQPRLTPEGQQRHDREGNPQWVTNISVVPEEGRRVEAIDVVVSGAEPQGITAGAEVRVTNLWSNEWAVDGRTGTSWRADAITAVAAPAAPGGAGASSSGARGKSSGGES